MNAYLVFLIGVLIGAVLGAVAVIVIGYKWGTFAALQALAYNSPKWKAYVLALLPPAAFAVTLLFDGGWSAFAGQTFWALATPAVVGTCWKYNRGRYAAF